MAGISITLGGNFSKLDELKDKAQKTAASVKSAFGSDLGKKIFGGVAIAATAAFAGVVASVKSAVDAGGALNDMMARTGASGEGLVVMQRAFENAGMAASQVPQALNKMQKALAGVNEEGEPTNQAFQKLGLSVGELIGLDPVAAFQKIQASISSIQDPASRTAIAMELFGRSGGEMLAVLTDSSAFSSAAEQVGGLGKTLSDNAAALDAVGDAFGALDTKVQQIGAEVAVALLPQLESLSGWLNETDFSAVGGGIGILAEKISSVASAFAGMAEYMPLMIVLQKFADMAIGTTADPKKAAEMAAKMADPNYVPTRDQPQAGPTLGGNPELTDPKKQATAKAKKSEPQGHSLADAIEKAKEAAAKKAAAVEEYNMDSAILSARLRGDAIKLASLEREKKIREEIKRLESSGFSAKEARRPAEAKVDAEKKATDQEDARKKIQDTLQGKLDTVKGKMDGQQFQSSLGPISDMQRVGGGGGAVSSGLDYARQSADLQREANGLIRQLIDLTRTPPEV